jgi:hypothetical protein
MRKALHSGLPRYVLSKLGKRGVVYYFNVPTWARKADCPVRNEKLGGDRAAAIERALTLLLPAFDAWRGRSENAPSGAPETLDWVFGEYRADRRFTKLDARTKRNHEVGFRLVGGHVLKDGRKLGTLRVSLITTAIVDALYDKLLVVKETDAVGNVIERERRTTVNHAMKSCRRAWNIAARRNPGKLPHVNPFAAMGLVSSDRETPTATFAELRSFRAKAIEMGLPSLATAALIGWEWWQREIDIFATFEVAHYRPKEHPNAARVVHEKTGEETWIPLLDERGVPLYPELVAELDAIKRVRIGGLMLRRDWGKHDPWPTRPREDEVDLTHMSRKVREVMKAAGLRDALTFTSFRHGGFTEGADADLTDAQIRAQSAQKTQRVVPKYANRTQKQLMEVARKRRAARASEENESA